MDKKIRILHVLTALDRGGIETMLMSYYRLIDRNIFQFDFLIHREGKFAYTEEIENLGGKIYHVPTYNPLDKKYYNALNKFFKEHSYEIVHSHMNCLSALPLYYAKKNGVPIRIAHSHIIINDHSLKSIYKIIAKHFIKLYATNYFACSIEAGKWMFGDKENIMLMRNAIDSKKFIYNSKFEDNIRAELGLDAKSILLGHVGRLTDQKNQAFLVKVLKNLMDVGDYYLLFIGDGEDKDKLRNMAVELKVEDKVFFYKSIPNVNEYMQAMDIFVFPSKYEGLGIVAVEAQAAGMPVLCSRFVPKEVKINDECFFLPLKEDVWVDMILKVNINKKRNMQQKIVDSHYDIYEAKNEIMDIYKNMYESVKKW